MSEAGPQYIVPGSEEAEPEASPPAIEHPDFDKQIRELQGKLDNVAEQIRSDRRLDQGEIRRRISGVWNEAQEARKQLAADYEQQLFQESAEAEKKVFRVPEKLSDSVRSAYNDVYDRVSFGFDSGERESISFAREELERLFERAERTGDKALLVACFHIAVERGEEALRDRYLSSNPETEKAWEGYAAARRKLANFQDPQERLWRTMTGGWGLRRPPEAG